MFIFILSLVCLFLALYIYINIWNTKRESPTSYIKETIDFFASHDTPWLSPEQLQLFQYCTTYDCYSAKIESLISPSLVISMLVGQPLKYIWRDRNVNELIRYLKSLKRNSIEWKESIRGHSSLYTDDFGEWPQGQDIIDTFTQTNQ
jgi:hypothetical protein